LRQNLWHVLLDFLGVGYVLAIGPNHLGGFVAGFATVRRLWKSFHKRFPRSRLSVGLPFLCLSRELFL
jgi:hypothetical protein